MRLHRVPSAHTPAATVLLIFLCTTLSTALLWSWWQYGQCHEELQASLAEQYQAVLRLQEVRRQHAQELAEQAAAAAHIALERPLAAGQQAQQGQQGQAEEFEDGGQQATEADAGGGSDAADGEAVGGGEAPERPGYPRLINFAHKCCERSKARNCESGLEHGFASCQSYGLDDLALDALCPGGRAILARPRGAGYWLWKPLLILQSLLEANDGEVVMYADTASTFIADAAPLLELAERQDVVGFALNGQGLQEFQWTKRDAFRILGAEGLQKTQQVATSFVIVRRSIASLSFISQWLTYAQDARALTDDPNVLGGDNYPGWRDHRHDQSLFSLLHKKWNLTAFDDPTQWGNDIRRRPYPQVLDHHRQKD